MYVFMREKVRQPGSLPERMGIPIGAVVHVLLL